MTTSLPDYAKLTFSEKERVLNEFKLYLADLDALNKAKPGKSSQLQ